MHYHRRLLSTFALVGAFSSAMGVQASGEELPAVQLKQSPSIVETTAQTLPDFDLPVEPLSRTSTTINTPRNERDAIETGSSGISSAAEADLQALRAYQQENPIGAWYGAEMHDRLAAAYPGYANYIADFAIVDSRGDTYYPSSETRQFLQQQARNGSTTRPALTTMARARAASGSQLESPSTSATTPLPRVIARRSRKRLLKASVQPAPASAPAAQRIATVAVASDTRTLAPAAAPTVVSAAAPIRLASTAPKVVAAATLAAGVKTSRAAADTDQPTTRGMILLVLGIAGVGILTMLVRTTPAPGAETPAEPANVETIKSRKAS